MVKICYTIWVTWILLVSWNGSTHQATGDEVYDNYEGGESSDEYETYSGEGENAYYYDYYEGMQNSRQESLDGNEEGEERVVTYQPEMLTQPTRIHVSIGTNVTFKCDATNSSEFVRIWVKDNQMLFTGNIMLYRSDRYSLRGSSLQVSRVEEEDSGIYKCSIMVKEQELSVEHTLNVTKAFFIERYPEDGNVEIEAGEKGRMSCVVHSAASDEYKVEWSREGQPFPNGDYIFEGDEFIIPNASLTDAGRYYCYAMTKEGGEKSATFSFMVKVIFAPRILSLDQSTFRTGEGYSLELTCAVVSQPNPKVTWYKGNEVVELDGRVETQTAGSRHVLIINSIQSNDIGIYMCYATNKAGSHQKQVEFSRSGYESRLMDLSHNNGDGEGGLDSSGHDSIPDDVLKKMEELEKGLNAEKEALSKFRRGIEVELDALRNLTYTAINSSSGLWNDSPNIYGFADNKFENAIFDDIERINLNLRRLEQTYEDQIQRLSEFSSEAKDDFLRLWDKVNELQEVTNQTTGNIEEIYDKDILILQNFRNDAKADIEKLRFEINSFLEEVQNFIPRNNSRFGEGIVSPEMEARLKRYDHEFKNIQAMIEKLKDDTFIVADELKGVHQDLDTFKKFQRGSDTLHLKIERRIDKINQENLLDLEHRMSFYNTKINDFDDFREKTDARLRNKVKNENERFMAIKSEVQKMKSQIYYLQQSILQLRSAELESVESQSDEPACVTMDQFSKHISQYNKRDKDYAQAIFNMQEKIRVNEEVSLIGEMKELSTSLKSVMGRLDDMEAHSKKFNLILAGIPPSRRLERAYHLEKSVEDFFKEKMNLTDVQISDIERIRGPNMNKIRVRFPSIMEKFRVLRLSRSRKGLKVSEDFSEMILIARRKLIAFARSKSSSSKRKWALKYDELFYNGRVYIYDTSTDTVVLKKS